MYRNMMRGKRGECLEDDLRRNAWRSGSYINRQCVNSRHSTAGMNSFRRSCAPKRFRHRPTKGVIFSIHVTIVRLRSVVP